jgi:mRNA interferase MazF
LCDAESGVVILVFVHGKVIANIQFLNIVTLIPLTGTIRNYPTRINCSFEGRSGQLAIDQIRCVDKIRLVKKLGVLDEETCKLLCSVMVETFKY